MCLKASIPDRLKRNGRAPISFFSINELLYHRCIKEELDNPYLRKTIAELSHNRSGPNNDLCEADDVLLSIKVEEAFEKYEDKEVCTLQIVDLNENKIYKKSFPEKKDGKTVIGTIELIHTPEECMYPHCVFRVMLDDTIVTIGNHKDTLKKHNRIRNSFKEELANMIISGKVQYKDSPQA